VKWVSWNRLLDKISQVWRKTDIWSFVDLNSCTNNVVVSAVSWVKKLSYYKFEYQKRFLRPRLLGVSIVATPTCRCLLRQSSRNSQEMREHKSCLFWVKEPYIKILKTFRLCLFNANPLRKRWFRKYPNPGRGFACNRFQATGSKRRIKTPNVWPRINTVIDICEQKLHFQWLQVASRHTHAEEICHILNRTSFCADARSLLHRTHTINCFQKYSHQC